MHPKCVEVIAFYTPSGLAEGLRMPQGVAGAPGHFIRTMGIVTAGLQNIKKYVDDAIAFDNCPAFQVKTIEAFFARLERHDLKLTPNKNRLGATEVDFRGHSVSSNGVRPNLDKVSALTKMLGPLPTTE